MMDRLAMPLVKRAFQVSMDPDSDIHTKLPSWAWIVFLADFIIFLPAFFLVCVDAFPPSPRQLQRYL